MKHGGQDIWATSQEKWDGKRDKDGRKRGQLEVTLRQGNIKRVESEGNHAFCMWMQKKEGGERERIAWKILRTPPNLYL